MELKNFMEDVVARKLKSILKQCPDCCACEKCRRDIMSLALNHLPPRYISTDKGDLYARVEMLSITYDPDIVEQIAKAITVVKQNPRHGDETVANR